MNLINTLALETDTPPSQWEICQQPQMLRQLELQEFPGLQRTYLNNVDGRLALVRQDGRHVTVEFLPNLPGEEVEKEYPDCIDTPENNAYKLISRELRHHLIQKDSKLEKLSLVGSLIGILTASIVLFFTLPTNENEISSIKTADINQIRNYAAILFWLGTVFALLTLYKKGKLLVQSKKLRAKKLHEQTAEIIIKRWENNLPDKKVVPTELGAKPILRKTQIIILDILRENLPKIHPCENPIPGGTDF